MTIEERRIYFSNNDLEVALATFGRTLGLVLPAARISSVSAPQTDNGSYVILFEDGDDKKPTKQDIKPHLILACLVRLCHQKAIPLPLRSKKTLILDQNRLGIKIIMDADMPEHEI